VKPGPSVRGSKSGRLQNLIAESQGDDAVILHPQQAKTIALRQKAAERLTAEQLALEMTNEIRNPLEAMNHLVYLSIERLSEPDMVLQYMYLAQEQISALFEISAERLGFAESSAHLPADRPSTGKTVD
jgi:hypothetical protein